MSLSSLPSALVCAVLLSGLLLVPASAPAQDCNGNGIPDDIEGTVFHWFEGFNDPAALPAGWTATGLWHPTDGACAAPNTCGGSPGGVWFGEDANCDFETGAPVSGVLTSPPILVPAAAAPLVLGFCSRYAGESGTSGVDGYDWAWVEINGTMVHDVSASAAPGWQSVNLDISAFVGQTITISFHFDSIDELFNDTLGWAIDHPSITYSPDCNGNGIFDACETDTNGNGVPDDCEAALLVRGNCNGLDAMVNIADAVFLLGHLFPSGGPPSALPCADACDANDDGALDIADAVVLLNSLFGASIPLPPPNSATGCGVDPDPIGCDTGTPSC